MTNAILFYCTSLCFVTCLYRHVFKLLFLDDHLGYFWSKHCFIWNLIVICLRQDQRLTFLRYKRQYYEIFVCKAYAYVIVITVIIKKQQQ